MVRPQGMRGCAAGWLVATLGMTAASLPTGTLAKTPDIELDQKVIEYAVDGDSARAIRESINAKREEALGDGMHFDGYTKWRVDWNFRYRQRGRLCVTEAVKVPVHVIIQVPSLTAKPRSDALNAKWQRYREALMQHEQKHADIAVAAGTAVLAALSDPAPEPCDSIYKSRSEAAQKIVADAAIAEREMDVATSHGVKDGARFP